MNKTILNIGILAHVDAGKTTITENILFKVGAIRTKGDVNNGSTVTDNIDIERKRGISVRTVAISFDYDDIRFNLIDTPGHVDFSAEVERSLAILDAAVLVVSAVEGVQAHTYNLWDALRQMKIPTLIVVNKLDRSGADYTNVLEELANELSIKTFPLYGGVHEGMKDANIFSVWDSNRNVDLQQLGLENLADFDEEILEKYLDGETISLEFVQPKLIEQIRKINIVPVSAAVAKSDVGTKEILEVLCQYFKPKKTNKSDFSAFVFKIEHDKTLGRLAHIKVFGGSLKSRDVVENTTQQSQEKVAQLKKVFSQKMEIIPELFAGDVGVISGLPNVNAGDILGNPELVPKNTELQHSVLTVQAKAVCNENYKALAEALQIMQAEDPTLNFTWLKEEQEMHLDLMGRMQTEILQAIIDERFGIAVEFTESTVIYKETPRSKAEGYVHYTMPKPCWAVCRFLIEPGEPNTGIIYKSKVSVDKIARKYQNEIEETIPKVLQQGIKGWEVSDIKITLIDGEDHEIHSRPGDFILATPMGIMDGLKNAGTDLLEPLFDFEIKAAEEFLGSIANDLTSMRANFANPEFGDGKFNLKGKIPVATSMDYSIKLQSITGGKGKIRLRFGGYQKCTDEQGVIREYRGVNPLDKSQWILHNRGAFKADERKF